MKKYLFFIVLLVVSLISFGQPKVVVQKKPTQIQRIGNYLRFITPEVVDSTMCYPPDPKCNYLNRFERLKYDEYLLKNKSGIFVPDSVMILAYKSRYKEEIFSFDEKLNGIEFFGFFKQRKEIQKTNIFFFHEKIIIQNSLHYEESFSVFFILYILFLFFISCTFVEFINKKIGLDSFTILAAIFALLGMFYFPIVCKCNYFNTLGTNLSIIFLQFLLTIALFLIRKLGNNKANFFIYLIGLTLVLLSSIFVSFWWVLFIILTPIIPFLFFNKVKEFKLIFN